MKNGRHVIVSNEVKIIFTSDALVVKNQTLKQFVEASPHRHCFTLIDGMHFVVIKMYNEADTTLEKVRMIAGSIAREASARKIETAYVEEKALTGGLPNLDPREAVQAFVEGWELGAYQFLTYKSSVAPFRTVLEVSGGEQIQSFIKAGKVRAEATAFSRDLTNEIPNVLNPETFPEVLKKAFEGTGVQVNAFNKVKLEELEMNGVLTVGRGSKYEPSFVELVYRGDESKPLVALVGKGVTFDTGGISLKSGRDLSDMRMDMGGAAAVSGALMLLAKMKAKVNVVGLLPIAENTPDQTSVFPSEIIRYKNGLTVQVGNTDAEGRLILADALIRAGEWNASYIVDIATLTGAIANALGSKIAGVFGDETLSSVLKEIGAKNGDHVWPMPLVDAYDCYLDSDYADLNNISSKGEAGSITAGLFLRRFVPKGSKWLHVDMAGTMDSGKVEGYYPKSATGYGARLLADYVIYVSK